jgi:hypothetical protein
MANRDFFADIAMTQHPMNHTDKEILPRPLPEARAEEGGSGFPYGKAGFSTDKPLKRRLEEFHQQLEALKKQYAPFLENHLPKVICASVTDLDVFSFRYAEKGEYFTQVEASSAPWEEVTIPDYRGPAGAQGKWRGYYRTHFSRPVWNAGERVVLQFQCVDYKALIYLNGNFIGQHEGFFAPFSFDVTDLIQNENTLIIEVQNDIPTKGDDNSDLDGDKLYAATGPGWDDPETGWHHCPPGAGVFGRVTVEVRPELYIEDIFARPDIDGRFIELRLGVYNYTDQLPEHLLFTAQIGPKNFTDGTPEETFTFRADIVQVGRGKNEYRYRIPMERFRLWTPQTPYLYGLTARIFRDGKELTCNFRHFGMRKFVSDETTSPKGKLFLNNRPFVLRGANEMGHLQQCVMQGDYEQLIEDILIAKLCHMNYYRLTQRPVQEEIYEYMDMLGMLNQTDLPLFSFLRRNQAAEAVRQAGEMEHLIRNHPSAVLVTFINEPVCIRRTEDPNSKFSKRYDKKGHRHLFRDELEAFFVAARKIIYIENPDRVIKNVEGDYDPPTAEGMPDFHTYTMWYSNHPIPIGRLAKGVIPPIKEGWMAGCGEYGAEGLEYPEFMKKHYPKEWLETEEDGSWYPIRIVRSQMNAMHGDWFAEQSTLEDWVRESQKHQALATRLMTDAFRRRADYISHTAIHLLIDAWPAGWMKTLVDCDRNPKPAYFAYMDSLEPVRLHPFTARSSVHSGQKIPVEMWLLNDTQEPVSGHGEISLTLEGTPVASFTLSGGVEAAYSQCIGILEFTVPQVEQKSRLTLDTAWIDEEGRIVQTEQLVLTAEPSVQAMAQAKGLQEVVALDAYAQEAALQLGLRALSDVSQANAVLVSTMDGQEAVVAQALKQGKTVLWLQKDLERGTYCIGEHTITIKKGKNVFFAAPARGAAGYSFHMLYKEKEDMYDFTARNVIETEDGEELVYLYGPDSGDGRKAPKYHRPVVKKLQVGDGTLYVSALAAEGKLGVNAGLDAFFLSCLAGTL